MKKWILICLLSQALAANIGTVAYGAQWQKDHMGWWYDNGDGTWPIAQWKWLDGNTDGIFECYYFDRNGYCMVNSVTPDGYQVNSDGAWIEGGVVQTQNMRETGNTGIWKQVDGRWYYEDTLGVKKANGWYWLDGNRDGISECYYLDREGWLLTDTITPDGYQVNADGAWTENGVVKTKGGGKTTGTGTTSGGRSSSGGGSSGGNRSSAGNTTKTKSGKKTSREHFWDDYEDYSIYHAANDFTEGNRGQMTESQINAVEKRIEEFKRKHIKSGMSDFEKEMQIIQWIVENCEYRSMGESYDWVDATAYSCIVNGKACCSGYADAFLQMAKSCGLSARYIYSADHAWNLVKLDGDWYHVDVTWEDQGNIWTAPSLFINLNDSIIKGDSSHDRWTPSTARADGIKYGSIAVDWYLEYGNDRFPGGEDLDRLADTHEDNMIQYHDIDQTVRDIQQYMDNQIRERRDTYEYVVKTDFRYEDSHSQADIHNLNVMLMMKGYGNLRDKYYEVLDDIEDHVTYKDLTQNNCYYIYKKGKITYKEECHYVIRFMEDGIEMGRKTGSSQKNKSLLTECPDGYVYVYTKSGKNDYVVLNGEGIFADGWLEIYEGPVIEIEVKVKKTAEDFDYQVIYVTDDGYTLYSSPMKTAGQNSIIYFEKMNFFGYRPKEGQEFKNTLTTDGEIFFIIYEKVKEKQKREKGKKEETTLECIEPEPKDEDYQKEIQDAEEQVETVEEVIEDLYKEDKEENKNEEARVKTNSQKSEIKDGMNEKSATED